MKIEELFDICDAIAASFVSECIEYPGSDEERLAILFGALSIILIEIEETKGVPERFGAMSAPLARACIIKANELIEEGLDNQKG